MSVVPVNIGLTQSNLQAVQRNEDDIPQGLLDQNDMQLLPFRERNRIIQDNMYSMMNIESIQRQSKPNADQEVIDISENGIQRATGEGVQPIVDILHSMEYSGMHTHYNGIGSNGSRSFHLRNSPFVEVITPLFQTGERIQDIAHEQNGTQQFKGENKTVSEQQLQNLPCVESADEDCSICLEELNASDVPPQKQMMSQKTLSALRESLRDRSIAFEESMPKKDLLEKLWEHRKVKNPKYQIKKLNCTHLFHQKCLKEWMSKRDTCPNCRKKVDEN